MAFEQDTIVFDFNTKFISPETRIWIVFPGNGYKFYEQFMANGVIFGDFPGLPLKNIGVDSDDDLRRWIAISEKVRSYHLGSKVEENAPSRNPLDYDGYTWTGRRRNSKAVIVGMYQRAKKGDLVLVTSRGQAWGQTRIGEFQSDGGRDGVIYERVGRYPDEAVPARSVRWIGEIANRNLPEELVRQLVSPNAFSQVSKDHYNLIFAAAYENYFLSGDASTSLFDIKSAQFSTVPDMYLKIIANFAANVARGIDNKNLEEILNLSLEDWILNLTEDEYTPDQKIRINSPGINLLQCIKMTPILATVLFSLMQYPAAELKASQLEFVNSAAGGELDQCDIPVADASKLVAQTMSLDKLEKLCKIAVEAKRLGNIQTPITSHVRPHAH